jgi:exopolysaccharide biosynthesis polyprenyl glycosylphosphotransferase
VAPDTARWLAQYLRYALIADFGAAIAAGVIALAARYSGYPSPPDRYLLLSAGLPLIWTVFVALARGYESRIVGTGADEYRRVINAGISLTAVIAILSYATKAQVSRGYLLVVMPLTLGFDLLARFVLRKRLHRQRARGACLQRTVAVGYARDVAELVKELRREKYHGLSVVAACLAGSEPLSEADVAGVPVHGGLDEVVAAVRSSDAHTVAVLACRELNALRLRQLSWELEKTDTDLCLAPALLDVAGPRTSVRPTAGLPLLYVDHPNLTGVGQVIKGLFDKVVALTVLLLLAPLMLAIAIAVRLDGGPALFQQVRIGKDGRPFRLYKFRTMVVDAEQRKDALLQQNLVQQNGDGVLFKLRNDPRVTRTGARLRRWSLDELPQLINVLAGQMSLVGPRPALPNETAQYGDYVRRRLAVRPGMTGLWQVHGRANLAWEEAVRLDLRYVENWSFALDLLILWKTWPAVARGVGAF